MNDPTLRTAVAMALIAGGFLLDLVLVVLVLGEGIAMARLSPALAAVTALLGGGLLMAGLAMIEARRMPATRAPLPGGAQAFSG